MKNALFTLLLLCLIVPVLANDTWMISGGTAQSMQEHSSVRMVSEKIDVKLQGNAPALVKCEFVFRNEGKAQVVKMGFPSHASGDVKPLNKSDLRNFRSWIDGKPTKVTFVRAKPVSKYKYKAWYVKEAHFKVGQTRTIVDTYNGRLGESAYGASVTGKSFTYILATGRNWKGRIGKAVVTIDISNPPPGVRFKEARPKGYIRRGNKLVWTFRNFEPMEDKGAVHIEYAPVKLPKRS